MTLSSEQLSALAELAGRATPGPWMAEWTDLTYDDLGPEGWAVDAEGGSVCVPDGPLGQREHDARFIAAANPSTVLSLIDTILQLQGEVQAISAAIGTVRFMDPPDGGDVPLAEQVRRMCEALDHAEAEREKDREALRRVIEDWGMRAGDDDQLLPASEQPESIAIAMAARSRLSMEEG